MSFIGDYIQNKAMGVVLPLVSNGITYAGGVAGNAVGGAGNLITNGGKSVGDGVAGFIQNGSKSAEFLTVSDNDLRFSQRPSLF